MTVGLVPGAAHRTCGAALVAALDDPHHDVIALGPGEATSAPLERLQSLLGGGLGIGAVVPRVRRADGRLLEAGALARDGSLVSRHLCDDDPAVAETAADVDGSAHPWVAFPRHLLAGVPLDPGATVEQLARIVHRAVRAASARTVYEPAWTVEAEGAAPRPPAAERSAPASGVSARILVVTGFLPSGSLRSDDRVTEALIDDLTVVAGEVAVTVAVVDGFLSDARAALLRGSGVTVVAGPRDWADWSRRRWGTFTHVLLTRSALLSPVREWIKDSQPQAITVLSLDSLAHRDIESFRPVNPPAEADGLDFIAAAGEAVLADWLRWADAAACARNDDAILLRALAPGKPVTHLPPDVGSGEVSPGADERQGVVLVASDGADVAAANEDAVFSMADAVLRPLRAWGPEVPITILSDSPTPRLANLARNIGMDLVPSGTVGAVGAARALLAGHRFGTGGQPAILAALAAGTPVIATDVASDGLELGDLRPVSVFADPIDIGFQLRQALSDDDHWNELGVRLATVRRTHYSPALRHDRLRALLARLGVGPSPVRHWPVPASLPPAVERPRVPPPLLRPEGPLGVDTVHTEGGTIGDQERYRSWHARRGPTSEVMASLRRDLAALLLRPTFSVVMPVYETDGDILMAAIDSVRNQIYDRWQLCLADDGSHRRETLDVLDGLAGDPDISVIRLAGNSGIAAATNAALAAATGEFVAFMDHDDILKPHALAQVARWINADPTLDVVYTDEDKLDAAGGLTDPHLKPDWSPDLLMSVNYISHLTVMRRALVASAGGLRSGFDGSQDYDLLLRVTELTDRVAHIPEPLYSWRVVPGSAAEAPDAKPYALVAAKRALREALVRRGTPGTVADSPLPTIYRTSYALPGLPKVSIVIPTRDGVELLRPCIDSILQKSTYANYEIVVVDNQSSDGETLGYLAGAPVRVIRYPHRFNYARQMNLAAASLRTDALLFLNNDTTVITEGWIEALLEHAMRPEVGAVGGRLYYADGRIQHEGILVGVGGWAWNVDHRDYFARGNMVRNTSAVTGACTMMRPTVYARIGGNDPRLRIAYNDVDLCLRVRQAGLQVVYTPYAELHHYEGATRKGWEHDEDGPLFGVRWTPRELVDPYYSPLFQRDRPFVIAT